MKSTNTKGKKDKKDKKNAKNDKQEEEEASPDGKRRSMTEEEQGPQKVSSGSVSLEISGQARTGKRGSERHLRPGLG